MKNKINILIFSLLSLIIIIPIGAKAINWQKTENIHIQSEETVDGNLYFITNNLIIDGYVNGDVVGLAEKIEINGRIEGDIITLSQEFNFSGEVLGSIRSIGETLNINGIIKRNLNILGGDVVVEKDTKISWDFLIAAINSNIYASIDGGLYGFVHNLFLDAQINKDVNLRIYEDNKKAGLLTIAKNTVINKNLSYKSKNKADIHSEAVIQGKINYTEIPPINSLNFIWKIIFSILSTILIALVLINLFKKPLRNIAKIMENKVISSFLWGFGLIIIFPIIIIILALTGIALKLAIILTSLWLVLLLLSKIITAIFVGRKIFNNLIKKPKTKLIWKMVGGVSLCWLLFSIPYIGSIASFIAMLWGAGALYLELKKSIKY